MLKLFAAGGGGQKDSRLIDEEFVRQAGDGKTLYIPIALDPSERPYKQGIRHPAARQSMAAAKMVRSGRA